MIVAIAYHSELLAGIILYSIYCVIAHHTLVIYINHTSHFYAHSEFILVRLMLASYKNYKL